MDDTLHDSRYPSKHYTAYNSSSYRSNPKRPILNQSYNEDEGYENDELDEENIDEDDDDVDEDDDVEENDEFHQNGYGRDGRVRVFEANDESYKRRQKKRKLDNLSSKYEFAPRVSVNLKILQNLQKLKNEWSEDETFILLEVWGDRFLQLGRKSLRSEDWADVAEKVTEVCKVEREHVECRNRLDLLKKKYKKEKAKMEEMGRYYGKWTFFKKMDMLLNASPRQQLGLACGVDSGEYVFMNPRAYLNQSNALDEMRDSPGESESDVEVDCDNGGDDGVGPDSSSFKLVADSIQKFGEIYEKIEDSKRRQMMELEKMRMDFHRELELQKSRILERAQAEIAKIRQGDDDDDDDDDGDDNENDDDASAENLSE